MSYDILMKCCTGLAGTLAATFILNWEKFHGKCRNQYGIAKMKSWHSFSSENEVEAAAGNSMHENDVAE